MARRIFDLNAEYGLDYTKGGQMVGADMNIAEFETTFPRMFERMKNAGPMGLGRALTDAEILQLMWFDACWGEAKWQGQTSTQVANGVLNSNNHIVVPWGTYRHTIPVEFSGGEYEMQGTGYTDVGNDNINTKLEPHHEGWLGNPAMRNTLVAGTWGQGGSFSYVEGTRFHNFRLNGRQGEFPGEAFESTGLMSWKSGEVTDSGRIWAENYRTRGFAFYAPTPHRIGNFSAFSNVVSGVGFLGSWGGTASIGMLSGDDNGAMFDMVAHNSTEPGGTISIAAIKHENQVTAGRVHRGMIVGYLRGQFCVNIDVISCANLNGQLPAAFVVDDRLTGGTPQRSALRFGIKSFGLRMLVHDVRRGRAFPVEAEYASGFYEYNTTSGRLVHMGQDVTPVDGLATYRVIGSASGTANMQPGATAYQEIITGPPVVGSPVYLGSPVVPPPPALTWIVGAWGPWSACVNGSQSRVRSVTSSIPGQTPGGTPPDSIETRACTITPPTGGGTRIAEYINFSNTDPNRSIPVNWVGVKRFLFTNLRVIASPNYQRLAHMSTTDSGLRIDTAGKWRMPGVTALCGQTPNPWTNGVTYPTAEIVLTAQTNFSFFLAPRSNGSAFLFTADRVEVFSE